jgi:hypothetical protein
MSPAALLRLLVKRSSHPNPLITPRFFRPITSATFQFPGSYRKYPQTKSFIISTVKKFAAVSGLDDAGADTITLRYAKEFSTIH